MRKLTPAQVKCLSAIHKGRGKAYVIGYRFKSASILEQLGLIEGDRAMPYWTWKLTDNGRWILNLRQRDGGYEQ